MNTTYTWSGSGLIADVQAWVSNPASNFGWVIRGNETTDGKAQRFNTGENTSNPPQLTVTYQVSSADPDSTVNPNPNANPGDSDANADTFTKPNGHSYGDRYTNGYGDGYTNGNRYGHSDSDRYTNSDGDSYTNGNRYGYAHSCTNDDHLHPPPPPPPRRQRRPLQRQPPRRQQHLHSWATSRRACAWKPVTTF